MNSVNDSEAQSAIVLFCHGSRDSEWREPFDLIARQVQERISDFRVEVAFLELMQPLLGTVIDRLAGQGCHQFRIVPLFLADERHTRRICHKSSDRRRNAAAKSD